MPAVSSSLASLCPCRLDQATCSHDLEGALAWKIRRVELVLNVNDFTADLTVYILDSIFLP